MREVLIGDEAAPIQTSHTVGHQELGDSIEAVWNVTVHPLHLHDARLDERGLHSVRTADQFGDGLDAISPCGQGPIGSGMRPDLVL